MKDTTNTFIPLELMKKYFEETYHILLDYVFSKGIH